MKLTIEQMVLERCEFSHRENFMSLPASTPVAQSSVSLAVQLARDEHDSTKALVRLIASSDKDATYPFAVTYVAFMTVELEEGDNAPDLDRHLMATGCSMVFPYVRQVVSSLSSQGRFGPTWIAPTNFGDLLLNPAVEEAKAR